MSSAELETYFQVLLDKYGSPEVVTSELYGFVNQAMNEYLNRLFPDNQGAVVNFEQDQNVTTNLAPLIYDISVTPASGLVTNAAITAALVAAGAPASSQWFRISSVGTGEIPVRYLKQNNRWAFAKNYFKRPSATSPRFIITNTGIQILPTTVTGSYTFNVVKLPKVLSSSVAPELGDYAMWNVLAIALQLAGVSLRDGEIIEDIKNISVQATK
jgi:hypothetical protein